MRALRGAALAKAGVWQITKPTVMMTTMSTFECPQRQATPTRSAVTAMMAAPAMALPVVAAANPLASDTPTDARSAVRRSAKMAGTKPTATGSTRAPAAAEYPRTWATTAGTRNARPNRATMMDVRPNRPMLDLPGDAPRPCRTLDQRGAFGG